MFHRFCLFALALAAALALTGPAAARADAPHKYALLIGISQYSKQHHAVGNHPEELQPLFPDLSCDQDLALIQGALVQTFKFDANPAKGEIVVLKTPEQTTRQGIFTALDRLIAETHPGDIVYIHYSGHGQQVPDATSPGGMDDAIVPSDYKDDLSNLIKGRELAAKLKDLQAKDAQGDLHGQIALSFDCCHSATATRGALAKKRGNSYKEYMNWYQSTYKTLPPQPQAAPAGAPVARGKDVIQDLNQPGYVVLSACANDSCAYETQDKYGNDVGRFSLALSDALLKADKDTTYQQVYEQVYELFRAKYNGSNDEEQQVPQVDGSAAGTLLGGTAVKPPPYVLVRLAARGHFLLDAGQLQGVTKGSTYALYPNTTRDYAPSSKIADATVTHVSLTTAGLQVGLTYPADLSPDALRAAHAVEVTHDFGQTKLTVDTQSIRAALPAAQADAVMAKLADDHMVSTDLTPNQIPDLRVVLLDPTKPARAANPVRIVRGDDGVLLKTLDMTQSDLPAQVDETVKSLAKYRYATTVLNQDDPNSHVRIRMRLIPAQTPELGDDGNPVPDVNGNPVFKGDKPSDIKTINVNDYFTVEVQNLSDTDLFVSVLDIDSDGAIVQVWPDRKSTAANNVVKAGATVRLWNGAVTTSYALFEASAPDVDEIYKAIATSTPVSYQAIQNRSMRGDPVTPSPFDALLEPATGTRSLSAVVSAPVNWATSTIHFKVIK